MTLDQLHVLDTILKTGSFRAASQKLHRAQSAVSYAIRTLEEEVGFALFDRSQYRPQLTTQGKAFSLKMNILLADYEDLQTSTHLLKLGHEPLIRISVSALFPMPLLAKTLQDFKKKFPVTTIQIYQDILSADQMLLDGKVDIVFAELFHDTSSFKSKKLLSVDMLPVCSPGFPLAKNKKFDQGLELKKYTQIILRSTSATNPRSAQVFNTSDTIQVGDFLSKKELLLSSLGWGFMPEHLVKTELQTKKLKRLPVEAKNIPLYMAYKANQEIGPCLHFLWEAFNKK